MQVKHGSLVKSGGSGVLFLRRVWRNVGSPSEDSGGSLRTSEIVPGFFCEFPSLPSRLEGLILHCSFCCNRTCNGGRVFASSLYYMVFLVFVQHQAELYSKTERTRL